MNGIELLGKILNYMFTSLLEAKYRGRGAYRKSFHQPSPYVIRFWRKSSVLLPLSVCLGAERITKLTLESPFPFTCTKSNSMTQSKRVSILTVSRNSSVYVNSLYMSGSAECFGYKVFSDAFEFYENAVLLICMAPD